MNRVNLLYRASAVKRCHTIYTHQQDTVGAHSFRVAMLCTLLTDDHPSVNLLKEALKHDLAEADIGDIPAHTKRKLPSLHKLEREVLVENGYNVITLLTKEEAAILKAADYLDLYFFCISEIETGNQAVKPMWDRANEYLLEVAKPWPKLQDKIAELIAESHYGILTPSPNNQSSK